MTIFGCKKSNDLDQTGYRMKKTTGSLGTETVLTFDSSGRVTKSLTSKNGETIYQKDYVYDGSGNLISDKTTSNSYTSEYNYQYNNNNKITKNIIGEYTYVDYTYNSDGTLNTETRYDTDYSPVVKTYVYENGKIKRILKNNQACGDDFEYNENGKPTKKIQCEVAAGGMIYSIDTYLITYNSQGQISKSEDYYRGNKIKEINYTYNSSGMLVKTEVVGVSTILYSYNSSETLTGYQVDNSSGIEYFTIEYETGTAQEIPNINFKLGLVDKITLPGGFILYY